MVLDRRIELKLIHNSIFLHMACSQRPSWLLRCHLPSARMLSSLKVIGAESWVVSGNRMREEDDCLYWPVKYSSNEAMVGGEVGSEVHRGKDRGKNIIVQETQGNHGRALQSREEWNKGGKEIFLSCGS